MMLSPYLLPRRHFHLLWLIFIQSILVTIFGFCLYLPLLQCMHFHLQPHETDNIIQYKNLNEHKMLLESLLIANKFHICFYLLSIVYECLTFQLSLCASLFFFVISIECELPCVQRELSSVSYIPNSGSLSMWSYLRIFVSNWKWCKLLFLLPCLVLA